MRFGTISAASTSRFGSRQLWRRALPIGCGAWKMWPKWSRRDCRSRESVGYTRSGPRMKFSYQVSYHEAGHAFAYWYIGVELRAVRVLSQAAFARRQWFNSSAGIVYTGATGVCETSEDLFEQVFMYKRNGYYAVKEACAKQIFASAAGPINTSFDTGMPLKHVFQSAGAGDMDKIEICCDIARISKNHCRKLIARSQHLLSSYPARNAMRMIARRLSTEGYVAGARVDSMCQNAFGSVPRTFRFSN